jgi:hypothetical protein
MCEYRRSGPRGGQPDPEGNSMKVLARGGRSRALAAIAVLATIALPAGASPAEAVPIKRGDTKLVLDPNIFPVLDAQGIGILPIPPAEACRGCERFPIAGGSVSRSGERARINHRGGLAFQGDNATVRLKRLKVHLNTGDSELIASVAGQRMSFLSLAGGRQTSRGRDLTFRGIHASFTRKAARTLNQAFATNSFQKGMRVGKLRIEMRLGR